MDFAARILEGAKAADRSAQARIGELMRWILANPDLAGDGERLAGRAAMSRRNLERLFQRICGTTPARFVEAARLAVASRLLEQTGLPVKAIAQRCGFGDEERMRRAFRRRFGLSPRAYAAGAAMTVPPIGYRAVERVAGSNLRRSVKSTFMP
jgi:transcriptional regulator GlxA family with amidase domain